MRPPAVKPPAQALRRRLPLRESLLLLGFVLLVVAAVVSVVVPELGRDPQGDAVTGRAADAGVVAPAP
jgi:hypothetical protein